MADAGVNAIGIDPNAEFERVDLDQGSWVDLARGWVCGADALAQELIDGVAWRSSQLFRYDHVVEERRLGSFWRPGRPLPHPAIAEIHRALQRRYKVRFEGFGLIQYRNGRDGQAFHRDTDMRYLDDTIIAILTLGTRRPWLLRPHASKYELGDGRGATHDLSPGSGDLLVMGGRSQADWQHSVPYLMRDQVGIRVSLQWRYSSGRGKPFIGASYRAPLTYSR
jgi:alkylated DNA repair dioxygenase AlkB